MSRDSSKFKIGRTRKIPGTVTDNSSMPKGWVWHSPGYITPTLGTFKGTPLSPDSKTARLLGWPGPCLTGQLNISTPKQNPSRYTFEEPTTSNNLHAEALKSRPISEPPPPSSSRPSEIPPPPISER